MFNFIKKYMSKPEYMITGKEKLIMMGIVIGAIVIAFLLVVGVWIIIDTIKRNKRK